MSNYRRSAPTKSTGSTPSPGTSSSCERWRPDAEVGQVWQWNGKNTGKNHCLLLRYVESTYDGFDYWEILDLDSDHAGQVTRGQLFVGERAESYWVKFT